MNDTKRTASYATFHTFLLVLEEFRRDSIPEKIDRESFENKSRHDKWQLLSAFKFLGLIDEEGIPTDYLYALVFEVETRPYTLRRVLESSYPAVFEYGINNLTRQVLDDFLTNEYNVNGETQKKARSFFTNACKFAGIDLPASITQRIRTRRIRAMERKVVIPTFFEEDDTQLADTAKNKDMQSNETQNNGRGAAQNSFSHTINLRSGGTLTLSAEVDVWKLSRDDRSLVFKLVDDMKDYDREEEIMM